MLIFLLTNRKCCHARGDIDVRRPVSSCWNIEKKVLSVVYSM